MKRFILLPFLLICLETFSQQSVVVIAHGNLYSLNLSNCTSQLLKSFGSDFYDIAFTPNGRLWGIVVGNLYEIDTLNWNASLVGSTGKSPVSLEALNDSTLLFEHGLNLYGLKTADASIYLIGTIGYSASGDLTWYDNNLYMNDNDLLIKITLNSTNTAILSVVPINNSINPIPYFEGMATANFPTSDNAIIGFPSGNAIKICPIDGTYQMLCPQIVSYNVNGGAVVRLPTQVPQPTTCTMTSVQEISSNNQFSIFPNPTANKLNIQTKFNQNTQLKIFNSVGQLIKTGILQSDLTTIDIVDFSEGVYCIELTTNSKHERQLFIVQK